MKKTHKASVKRFKLTASGKLRHNRQKDNAHLKVNKTRAQKSRLNKQPSLQSNKEVQKIKSLIGA